MKTATKKAQKNKTEQAITTTSSGVRELFILNQQKQFLTHVPNQNLKSSIVSKTKQCDQ